MTNKFLRNKNDGTIYRWNPILAANADCEEVTEQEAFPEKFMDQKQVKRVQKNQRKTKTTLNLSTDDIPEEPSYTNDELNAEASRNLPE